VHSDFPTAAYLPEAQDVHGVEGFESRSAVPAAHLPHSVAAAFENVPVEHVLHAVEASLSRSAVPDVHCVHTVAAAFE
jgi:hypothetical protein